MPEVRLATGPIDVFGLLADFAAANADWGGLCSFVGQVRGEDGIEALELMHYAPLTLPGMEALADAAVLRFAPTSLLMVHRIGLMEPGEAIVCVAAAAVHRRAAIEAVDYTMDHLKAASWFWKRERRAGRWCWIEPRAADHADLARWVR